MNSSQGHVAEKLDFLDPECSWRKDMKIVVDRFTELLPLIKGLLCGPGDAAAQRELPEKFPIFSAKLEELILQLQSSLDELRQRKAEWESALSSRSGDMARLDRQVQDLFEETLRATEKLESRKSQTTQEGHALESLQLRVKNAEAELQRAQDEDASIRQSQANETRRLLEAEIRLQDQEQALLQREEALTERSQKFEDYQRAEEKYLEDKKLAMEQAQVEHQKVLQEVQTREIAVGKTENEQEKAKTSLEKTSLDIKSAHSVLTRLANISKTGFDPSSAGWEALADALSERYPNLQEVCNTKQQTLDQAVQRNSGLEAELESTTKTLRDMNILHTDQMKGYENYKYQVTSLESKVSELEKLQPLVNKLKLREAQLGQANNYTVMENELSAKNNAIERLQDQLTHAQAEIERFKLAHFTEHTPRLGNGHGAEAQQDRQTSGVRNHIADDMAPDLRAGQQISGARKRKAGDMDSDLSTEQQHPGAGNRRVDDTAPGLSANQQRPSARNHSTWSIGNLRDPTYVPDPPLPAAVLSRLRARFQDWDARKIDWTKPRIGRRCAETVTSKKASLWSHGEAFQCEYCKKHKMLCVVVEKGGNLTLLPTYQDG